MYTRSVDALPVISQSKRDELAAQPKDSHATLLNAQVFAETVEVRQAPKINPPEDSICEALAWNVERCRRFETTADLLISNEFDLLFLTEMDYGMARSGQKHTTARLAEIMGLGYVYGVEYLEFGHGTPEENKRCLGKSNDVGYHGNAILSRSELKRPALIRLETSGEWFKRDPGEARLGGRMAVLATIEIGGHDVTCASVHLEDRTDPAGRKQQMEVLLRGIEEYAPGAPAVIAGDLNSFSFDLHKLSSDPQEVRRLMAEDPDRLLHPEVHEPLFAAAAEFGYDWKSCNELGVPTERLDSKPLSLPGCKKTDWFLTRGLISLEPEVIGATPADISWPLSDHELIYVVLKPIES